jgi:hypothetical protein
MLTGAPPFVGRQPREIYHRVLHNKLHLPSSLGPHARDLIKRLLQPQVDERLGCGGRRPSRHLDELKRHKWFKGIDWDRLRKRDVAPPYVPPSSYEGDSRNYLSFDSNLTDDVSSADSPSAASIDQTLFADF